MAYTIAQVRTAIATRLNELDDVAAYDTPDGRNAQRLNQRVIIRVFPVPWDRRASSDGSGFYPASGQGCSLRYNFNLSVYVGLAGGLTRAQDIMDAYICPAIASTRSIERVLEDPYGEYTADDLDTYIKSINVGQFAGYDLVALDSEQINSLWVSIPVEVLLDGSS